MDSVIKRVSDKQRKELDYGVPEVYEFDSENLGSCITGEWRQNDNQKDN
jgi:hypothetical protein